MTVGNPDKSTWQIDVETAKPTNSEIEFVKDVFVRMIEDMHDLKAGKVEFPYIVNAKRVTVTVTVPPIIESAQ
jgi:hypothetical protein